MPIAPGHPVQRVAVDPTSSSRNALRHEHAHHHPLRCRRRRGASTSDLGDVTYLLLNVRHSGRNLPIVTSVSLSGSVNTQVGSAGQNKEHTPMRKRTPLIAAIAALSLVAASCSDDAETADTTTTAAPATSAAPADEAGDIVAVATAAGSFNTLAAALGAAGLVETLQGEGPFTVFAPTDAAFAALPAGLVDALLLPENVEILTDILLFHVIVGSEVTSDMVAAGDVEMASGDTATIAVDGANISIAGAPISAVDVAASNGVIHVIDAVMVPADVDVSALLAD